MASKLFENYKVCNFDAMELIDDEISGCKEKSDDIGIEHWVEL